MVVQLKKWVGVGLLLLELLILILPSISKTAFRVMADRGGNSGGSGSQGGWNYRWGGASAPDGSWNYRWGSGSGPGGRAWSFGSACCGAGGGAGFGFGWGGGGGSGSYNGGGGGGGGGFGFGSGGGCGNNQPRQPETRGSNDFTNKAKLNGPKS